MGGRDHITRDRPIDIRAACLQAGRGLGPGPMGNACFARPGPPLQEARPVTRPIDPAHESPPMKLGFASISALDRPLADAAALAARAGADALEISARPPHLEADPDVADAARAGRVVRDAGLEVVAFGSYFGREPSLHGDAPERAVACAVAMQAPLLRVWAEPAAANGVRDEVVTSLQRACDAAAPEGIDVVVERHVGSYAETPADARALLDDVNRPNFALNYQVLDFLPVAAVPAQADDARALVEHARYFHLKNYRLVEGQDRLLPGGDLEGGAIDYRALLGAAIDAGYAGPFTLEFVSWAELPLEEKVARDLAYARGLLSELGA